jgi:hypothetical protein
VVVYLLDVNNMNEGALFSYSPMTFKNAVIGQPLTLDFNITMCSYDLHPESRLGVVISSHDFLFLDQNEAATKITFMSDSVISIPVHN